jgi:hypothetical protein
MPEEEPEDPGQKALEEAFRREAEELVREAEKITAENDSREEDSDQ